MKKSSAESVGFEYGEERQKAPYKRIHVWVVVFSLACLLFSIVVLFKCRWLFHGVLLCLFHCLFYWKLSTYKVVKWEALFYLCQRPLSSAEIFSQKGVKDSNLLISGWKEQKEENLPKSGGVGVGYHLLPHLLMDFPPMSALSYNDLVFDIVSGAGFPIWCSSYYTIYTHTCPQSQYSLL